MLMSFTASSSTSTLLRVLKALLTLKVTLVFSSSPCSGRMSGSGNSWMQDRQVSAAAAV